VRRPRYALPGTGGSITGTAVNDWVDDDGNALYGEGKGEAKKEGQGSDE
jgi:hypothetical protein